MEPTTPDWLNAGFLKQSLESDARYRDIDIVDFNACLAAPAGSNYGGLVVRVTVNCKLRGDDHKLSVIAKGPVTEGTLGKILSQLKNSEPSFYKVYLPEVNRLSGIRFAPNTFHSPTPSVIVMEDLREAGYELADRIKRLDLEHCLLYTKAAAAFHAGSMALYKQNPDMISSLCVGNFFCESGNTGVMASMNKCALLCMASNISDKKVSGIVRDSCEHMWSLLVDIHRPSSNNLNSLLQNDPWTTNMMFKYDSRGNVCDIKLLDFQLLQYSTPVHDLVFFIWCSANDDVREHHLRDLYSNYLDELNNNLRYFSYPEGIDSDSFIDTVRRFSPFALATISCTPAYKFRQNFT